MTPGKTTFREEGLTELSALAPVSALEGEQATTETPPFYNIKHLETFENISRVNCHHRRRGHG